MSEGGIFDLDAPFAPPAAAPPPRTQAPPAPVAARARWRCIFSLRIWYALGALLAATMLFALYNPTPWAARAAGWPHEAFRSADGAWQWAWGREQATVLFFAGCAVLSLIGALMTESRRRGVVGLFVGVLAVVALSPAGEELAFFMLPVLMCLVTAGLLMPAGTWRKLVLGIGMFLLAAHFFLPWPQPILDATATTDLYRCTAINVVENYTRPDVIVRPDPTGARVDAPPNEFMMYVYILLQSLPTSMGLLLLMVGALGSLGILRAIMGRIGAGILTLLVVSLVTIQFIDGWQRAPVGAIPISGWEGGLKTLGEVFSNSFVLFALPAAAGLLDLARAGAGSFARR